MNYLKILKANTKDGKEIKFELCTNVEVELNRGCIVDQIIAMVDKNPIGYIKMSYIPKELFESWYPNVFSWFSHFKGIYLPKFNEHMKNSPIENWRSEETKEFLKELVKKYPKKYFKNEFDYESNDIVKQLLFAIKKDPYFKYLNNSFIQFKDYHVDKPIVDYVDVTKEWRRKNVGTELYKRASEYLNSKGFRLYSSEIQSDNAKKVWKNFEDKNLVNFEKNKYIKNKIRKTLKMY